MIGATIGLGAMSLATTPPPAPVTPIFPEPETSAQSLKAPDNLFTKQQTELTDTTHVELRDNWTIQGAHFRQIDGNGRTNDLRLHFGQPLDPSHAHVALWQYQVGTTGRYRPEFGGAGTFARHTRFADFDRPQMHYLPASSGAAFTRLSFRPFDDTMDAILSDVRVFDLSSTDPAQVPCDVVLCLGDSNMGNTVSDFATGDNLETPFDPRMWYIPCLRFGGNFGPTDSVRHVPQPCLEPVQGANGAKRISPVMACAGELVDWSAARGRPLVMLALGDPGSGLNGPEEWDKTSTVNNTGGVMYDEMLLMLDALNALGPAHTIIGAVVSLGASDTTAADYAVVWEPKAQAFVSNIRNDLSNPNLPVIWMTPGEHFDPTPGQTRGSRMITAIERLDQDSGSDAAIQGVKAVRPPNGNALGDASDPHFNAAGMQANGRTMGQALLGLL